MGRLDVEFDDSIFQNLLQKSDEVCMGVLDDVAPILRESIKKNVRSVVGPDATGQLETSVKASKAKKSSTGAYIVNVGPKGKAKGKTDKGSPLTNAGKMVFLEYGTKNQAARPFLQRAVNEVEEQIQTKMQEAYERRLNQ